MKTIARAHLIPGPHIIERSEKFEAFGKPVENFKEDPSIELSKLELCTGRIPFELAGVTRHFSIHDEFYGRELTTRRTTLSYRHGNAEAIVEREVGHLHKVCASGTMFVDVKELCERIRAGSIAPIAPHTNGHGALHRFIGSLALSLGEWRARRHGGD